MGVTRAVCFVDAALCVGPFGNGDLLSPIRAGEGPARGSESPGVGTHLWFWESRSRCGLRCVGGSDVVLFTTVCDQNGSAEIELHDRQEMLNLQEYANFGSTVHYEIRPQLSPTQAHQNNSITHESRRFGLFVSRGETCDGVLDYLEFTQLGVGRPDS
jgi:hypothetical protein